MPAAFAYRLPATGEDEIHDIVKGVAAEPLPGIRTGSFICAPFTNNQAGIFSIPDSGGSTDHTPTMRDVAKVACANASLDTPHSSTQCAHCAEVGTIVESLGSNGKIVAARCIAIPGTLDIEATFRSLCTVYPGAFVFLFSTEETGTWIGASPELLIDYHATSGALHTVSLAGTRPASTVDSPWDIKNIEEQQMVTDYIASVLSHHTTSYSIGETATRKAGPVEHICTTLTATLRNSTDTAPDGTSPHAAITPSLSSLLADLSPTPALCGSDREKAMRIIADCEEFDREYYGGYCGPVAEDGSCRLFVNLRSARVHRHGIALFAGGGITPLSIPQNEWLETERKASTLISRLNFIEKR